MDKPDSAYRGNNYDLKKFYRTGQRFISVETDSGKREIQTIERNWVGKEKILRNSYKILTKLL